MLTFIALFSAVRKGSGGRWRIQRRVERHLDVAVERNGRIKYAAEVNKRHRSLFYEPMR